MKKHQQVKATLSALFHTHRNSASELVKRSCVELFTHVITTNQSFCDEHTEVKESFVSVLAE